MLVYDISDYNSYCRIGAKLVTMNYYTHRVEKRNRQCQNLWGREKFKQSQKLRLFLTL